MNNITFAQYRKIDLCIFSALLVISEAITTLATRSWFDKQPIAISTTLLFICIMMMRWGAFSLIPAALGGAVFCFMSGASWEQYLIYVLGNCLTARALLWFKVFKKDEIRRGGFKLFFFVLSNYLLLQIGRWLVSIPFGGFKSIVTFLATDIISLLFAAVIMFILRSVDGMIEDQKAYLFRLQREKEDNGYQH